MKKIIYLLFLLVAAASSAKAQSTANVLKNYQASMQNGSVVVSDGTTSEDIIKQHGAASHYDSKNVVENVFTDKNSGRVYFTASSIDKQGNKSFLTWKYDVQTKQLSPFRDGKTEGLSDNGDLTISYPTSTLTVGSDGRMKSSKTTNN